MTLFTGSVLLVVGLAVLADGVVWLGRPAAHMRRLPERGSEFWDLPWFNALTWVPRLTVWVAKTKARRIGVVAFDLLAGVLLVTLGLLSLLG